MSKRSISCKSRALFVAAGAVALASPAFGDLSVAINPVTPFPATWPNTIGLPTPTAPVLTSASTNTVGLGEPNNGGQASVPSPMDPTYVDSETFTPTSSFNLGAISFEIQGPADPVGNSISVHLIQMTPNFNAPSTSYNLSTQSLGVDLLGGGNGLTFSYAGSPNASAITEFDFSNNAAGGGTNDQVPLVAGTTYAFEFWVDINMPNLLIMRNSGGDSIAQPYTGGGFFGNTSGEDDAFEANSSELRAPIDAPTPRNLLFAVYPAGAVSVPPTWTAAGGGSWTNSANWQNGNIPNSAGVAANFGSAITANSTVTLDAAETVGAVNFNNTNSYTLAAGSGGVLVLNNGGGTASATVTSTSGNHVISAPIVMNSTGSFVVSNAAGTLTLSGNISGSTFSSGGAGVVVVSGSNTWGGGGTQIAGGTLRLGSNSALPTGAPVNVTTNATLDLNGQSATTSTLFGDGIIDNVAGGGTSVFTNGGATGNSTFSGFIINTSGSVGINYDGGGTLTLAPRVRGSFVSNTFSGGLTISSGTVAIGNTLGLPSGSKVVNNGTFSIESGTAAAVVAGKITGSGTLQVGNTADGSGGFLQLASGSGADTLGGVTIASGSTLDITNNRLVINYNAAANDPTPAVAAALASGFNGGNWAGLGINSSTAAAAPTKFAVGYEDGNVPTDALGKTVTANQLKVAYTLAGDAFLEGSVGFDDLIAVAQNFGKTGEDWAGGNFNYDPHGSVGFADLISVAQNFGASLGISQGSSGGGLSAAWQTVSLQSTALNPEPASAALATLAAAGLLGRRRRARKA